MVALSVNINKLATLRNARGHNNPDVIAWAQKIVAFGAHGITVHPRPDERHIRKADVIALKETLNVELNIEGYPSPDFCKMVLDIKPAQVNLVPVEPGQLTSDHGWDTTKHQQFLQEIILPFKNAGIRVSIFLDPNPNLVVSAFETGADRIELYTEYYANTFKTDKALAIKDYITTAFKAHQLGLGINAGHDLDLQNLTYFCANIPNLDEVSIGHALICDALEFGMENTIKQYLNATKS